MAGNWRKLADESFKILVVIMLLGLVAGIGIFTFVYARGYSYLTNDPNACANCHIMRDHFAGWVKSSHHAVAACNDCHAPHDNLLNKYLVKAENGFWHSFAFTTGRFHDPIQIREKNRKVTEQACRHCHDGLFQRNPIQAHQDQEMSCIRCHGSVGHMK